MVGGLCSGENQQRWVRDAQRETGSESLPPEEPTGDGTGCTLVRGGCQRWGRGELTASSCCSAVLVRYLREDNKLHSVNLQHAHVADGQSHTVIVRLSGLRGDMLSVELYVDCKQMDSSVGLPELSEIPLAEVESIEVRTGQKAYQRMQVSAGTPLAVLWGQAEHPPGLTTSPFVRQGVVESMKLILGGSMSRVGALSECPFQGDESIHSAGNGMSAPCTGQSRYGVTHVL